MFRVSRRVDYGLRLLIALASDSAEGPQSTASLAEKLDIPLAFLHQIGRSLIQAGILKASPGPGGGLRLNRSPESVTLRQVLEVLEGPIRLNGEEPGEALCSTQGVWEKVQAQLVNELEGIRLNGLAESVQGKGDQSFYSLPQFDPQNNPIAI